MRLYQRWLDTIESGLRVFRYSGIKPMTEENGYFDPDSPTPQPNETQSKDEKEDQVSSKGRGEGSA